MPGSSNPSDLPTTGDASHPTTPIEGMLPSGTAIGPYRILQTLGEGGFGVVYLAEQREPVVRKVALKIIKHGMDSREVLARFESERQAMALMDHPNIARFFEAGVVGTGLPYFAMEFVPGKKITQYCDDNKLTTRERLELFVPVCLAVQHAHQKGVIHRDLKPGNVLVTVMDGKPVPKVIDFGIAKAIATRLTDRTIFTEMGRLLGTPEYMSPEQAGTSGTDVDVRSDVYSLGVMLYELLAGVLPFDPKSIRAAGYDEMLRVIREQDPPRMTTRLSSLGEAKTLAAAAARRAVDPRDLERQLRGDLDLITMKALEKDRTRRYSAADKLAEDIGRYLQSEPILARPPSFTYRFGKFVRRNKGAVAAATVIITGAIVGVSGLAYAYQQATENAATERTLRTAAEKAQQAEAAERARAENALSVAEAESRATEASNAILREFLRAANPRAGGGRAVTVRDVASALVKSTEGEGLESPGAAAVQIAAIGKAVFEFDPSSWKQAEQLLERAARSLGNQAGEEAVPEMLVRKDLAIVRAGSRDPDRIAAAIADQRALITECAALAGTARFAAGVRNDLAVSLNRSGAIPEALAMARESVDAWERVDPRSPRARIARATYASILEKSGDRAAAAAILRSVVEEEASLAPTSDSLGRLTSLAELERSLGRPEEARAASERAMRQMGVLFADHDPRRVTILNNEALIRQRDGDLAGAAALFQEQFDVQRAAGIQPDASDFQNLANVLHDLGRSDEAEPLAREALARRDAEPSTTPADRAFSALLLGRILSDAGRATEAEPLLRTALAGFDTVMTPANFEYWQVRSVLGAALMAQGKLDEAGPLILESYPKIKELRGAHLRTVQALERAILYSEKKGDEKAATEFRAERAEVTPDR